MDITGKTIRLYIEHGISVVTSVFCTVESVNEYGWYLRVVETGNYKNQSRWLKGSLCFVGHADPLQFTILEE
jgi:hypothetical protein